jgi:hypothetical protein
MTTGRCFRNGLRNRTLGSSHRTKF